MSCQNNRKRNRDTMENDEVKEEYVGIIRADSIGEPKIIFQSRLGIISFICNELLSLSYLSYLLIIVCILFISNSY